MGDIQGPGDIEEQNKQLHVVTLRRQGHDRMRNTERQGCPGN
jgi:hypothetical protein